MELVIALSIIFSVIALFTAIYIGEELMKLKDKTKSILDLAQKVIDNNDRLIEELMKLRDRTERILDLAQRVMDNNDRLIEYIDVLEDRTKKEDDD